MKSAEILNYASILPEKKRRKVERAHPAEQVHVPANSRKKKIRLGRGRSSGCGKTSGFGQKGQKARTGVSRKPGFEGGQMPIHRRLPKRGFRNIFKIDYQVVNLHTLQKGGFQGEVLPETLKAKSLIADPSKPLKILGTGEISSAIQISADAFSESAKAKIEKAGGSCTIRQNPELQMTRRPRGVKKEKTAKK